MFYLYVYLRNQNSRYLDITLLLIHSLQERNLIILWWGGRVI